MAYGSAPPGRNAQDPLILLQAVRHWKTALPLKPEDGAVVGSMIISNAEEPLMSVTFLCLSDATGDGSKQRAAASDGSQRAICTPCKLQVHLVTKGNSNCNVQIFRRRMQPGSSS